MTAFDDNDIAIIGMGIRVPGASTCEEFWENLRDGVESLRAYTDEELLARGVSQATLNDPAYVKAGMPLQGIDQFDPEFFGFSPKEAAILDPQHRQFYEVAWEALDRAGHPPKTFDGNIGVFAGCGMGAYFAFNLLSNPDLVDSVGLFLLRHTGNDKDFLATRVSYAFDLKGPSVNVQTACSTSLVATHMAVQSLLARETDLALAGGVTIELPHGRGYHYKEGEILSPDGHCRSFDHRSKGTVFGSGVGVVVLRRLSDAIAAGDHIHAVIKGSAVNNDGSGKVGYLAPSVDGQAAAIAEALAISGVDADSVSYVECHGTATPVGDPIEIAALTQAFRESSQRVGYCRVGSVKSNIGHLDTAAGVASLIKTALALEHKQIPPSLNFEAPNPTIGFEGSPFVVASKLTEWNTDGGPRRAGVNSLGVGGTNAFVVLQEGPAAAPATQSDGAAHAIVLSARNKRALDDASARLAKWLRARPDQSLGDVAYTLLEGRHGFEHRRVLAAKTHEEAAALLENNDARRVFNHTLELERPSVVFMYPGGGAQYFQMGRGLYGAEPVFREHVDRGLAVLKNRFKADLEPVFFAEEAARERAVEQLAKPSVQLPLIFLVEYALTRLWQQYGVEPAAIVGHSLGENTAACIAGVISFEDALGLVLLRGQLMDEVPEGAMLSVSLPARELVSHLGHDLDLAAANSPQLSVASGPAVLIDQLAARLTTQGIESQRVRINIAAHSRLLDGILERFRQYLRSIRLNEPTLPIISNRTGTWLDPRQARDPEYWVEHLRNTVLFADGIAALLESPDRVFIEVGPGNTLGSFARQGPQAPAQRVFASLRHHQDPVPDEVYFKAGIARLWAVGVKVDTEKLWGATPRRCVPLPSYPFQHASYWIEPGVGSASTSKEAAHPARLRELNAWFRAPRWVQQGILDADETPRSWLVFRGAEPIADAMIERLRATGNSVVVVRAGDTFAQLDAENYTIAPEAGGVGYQELIEALAASERLPDRVLHTWLLTWDRSFRPGSSFFHRNQEYGFYSLLHLAQALGKASVDKAMHFIVAANGVQTIAAEAAAYPDKATALGPCAVIPREFPNISCRFVDVEIAENGAKRGRGQTALQRAAKAIDALAGELTAAAKTDVIAWRDGVRWQRHVAAWRATETAAVQRIRERGVYLITGGLGGIAGVVAEWLAREYRARLVLVARTPLPQRADWNDWIAQHGADDGTTRSIQRIRKLESFGAQVLALDADVTVAERMSDVLKEASAAFGEINGVFHTAGVIRDNLIQLKNQRDIEEVFSAKVYGTVVLDELFRTKPLDFMILFSSTSSFIAPQGQIDYVGANSFLNAFADACAGHRPYPVTAINWGIWQGVGMVGAATAKANDASMQALVAHGSKHATIYPHFSDRYSSRDGLAHVHLFEGTFSAERDWVIDEHRLANGEALLPGTGYLELVRAALAEAAQVDRWYLSNLVFVNPLFVRNGEPRPFRVRLRGDEERWEVEIHARRLGTTTADDWDLCATARVVRGARPTAVLNVDELEGQCTVSHTGTGTTGALRTRQEDHLRFGPRWRVLKRLSLGKTQAIARLQLASEYAGELGTFGLHPGLLDIATGCAMDLIPGYAAQEVAQHLWAPISYRGFRLHAPLTADLVSWLRVTPDSSVASGFARFDVSLCDMRGNVLAEIEQLTLRRIDVQMRAEHAANELPSAQEAASIPDKTRAKPVSLAEAALQHNVTQGIDAEHGVQALARVLGAGSMPATVIVSSMDLNALLRQADSIAAASTSTSDTRFSRPQLDSEFEAPRDEIERALGDMWGKLLGVQGVGIRDSFFDLGGHSLIAVRLFNEIADHFKVDLPMSVLMQSPTIASLGDIIRAETGADVASEAGSPAPSGETKRSTALQYQYVVPMHTGPVADRTPIFMVAGMFGNVLNLSHMAHLLGEERPFYALQARGLYGDAQPHEAFEEMSADYIVEIRKVQPTGPYIIGGFSGGGITAYEIARQLLAQGEQVLSVIMLDTPLRERRTFSVTDRISMFMQGFNGGGLKFLRAKIHERLEWERQKRALRREQGVAQAVDPLQFQSKFIGDAFMRALLKYRVTAAPLDVALFRPKLDVRFHLSGGRRVDSQRNYISEDNGWKSYVQRLDVFEVPGNHDSMVLEPNVRVLVSLIRRAIHSAEKKLPTLETTRIAS